MIVGSLPVWGNGYLSRDHGQQVWGRLTSHTSPDSTYFRATSTTRVTRTSSRNVRS